MNVNVATTLYIMKGLVMIAIRILVIALLAIIIIGGILIYKSDDEEFRQVRCIDCKNWDGKQCDLDEYLCGGTLRPTDYESILYMPYYEDSQSKK